MPKPTLHDVDLSGHAHRARLMLSLLGIDYTRHAVDLRAGEHKSAAFLAKNPLGQVPTYEDGDVVIRDSNAILVYLALKHDPARTWLPRDPADAARVQAWLTTASKEVVEGCGAARLVHLFKAPFDLAAVQEKAHKTLAMIEGWLDGRVWLALDHPTIADVSAYSYIAHAPEGGVSLEAYPNVRAWLARIEALDGFVPMTKSAHPN